VNEPDPRQVLAYRLRALREEHWPGRKVKQEQLAAALGSDGRRPVSVPLISSWESRTNPKVPPPSRIEDIATFYASPRSFDGRIGRLLSLDEMTVQEKAAREELLEELTRLRGEARAAQGPSQPLTISGSTASEIARSLSEGPYRFGEDENITVVCAQLPREMLQQMPYTDPSDPDFIKLYGYSDLDSLLELFGHLRAANSTSHVEYRAADQLTEDDYTGHLVSLGGVDWNEATTSVLERLQLPVKQVSEWDTEGGAYFEVPGKDGRPVIHRPRLDELDGRTILREDVALFARAVSPFNRKRFVTICNGMYGRGTYGAVRALTDERFRDRNKEYIQAHFADSEAFCILTRVTVENSVTLTPDWTLPETRLFEWSRPR
jgi:transcriptional regulator with XRE-family HTH domain